MRWITFGRRLPKVKFITCNAMTMVKPALFIFLSSVRRLKVSAQLVLKGQKEIIIMTSEAS